MLPDESVHQEKTCQSGRLVSGVSAMERRFYQHDAGECRPQPYPASARKSALA